MGLELLTQVVVGPLILSYHQKACKSSRAGRLLAKCLLRHPIGPGGMYNAGADATVVQEEDTLEELLQDIVILMQHALLSRPRYLALKHDKQLNNRTTV